MGLIPLAVTCDLNQYKSVVRLGTHFIVQYDTGFSLGIPKAPIPY